MRALCRGGALLAWALWGCQDPAAGAPGDAMTRDDGRPEQSNVVPIEVNPGPAGDYVNGLFASLTVCVPGTGTCQTIDGLLVDTGSVGIRIPRLRAGHGAAGAHQRRWRAAGGVRTVPGPGRLGPPAHRRRAAGVRAHSSVPIQVIDDGRFRRPPDCTGVPITDVRSLGANGVLGLGMFARDCGEPCSRPVVSVSNPGMYYACGPGAGDCGLAAVPVAKQLPHPVTRLSDGNGNGLVIQLDDVPAGGAPSVRGTIVLGIGTRPDNGLGSATRLVPDQRGVLSVSYPSGGPRYGALLDTGSNATYFLDPALSGIPRCTAALSAFYCPPSLTTIDATLTGGDAASVALRLLVDDARALLGPPGRSAHRELAGPLPGFTTTSPGFVLGLPVHFGRRVFIAIEGQDTPAGPGPFVAL